MFKKYKPFFKAGSMGLLAYKFNVFSWFFISILQWICLVFLWISVYRGSENGMDSVINGFTFKEMIVYMILINIVNFTAFINDTMDIIVDEIKDGTIAISFIRPISYRGRFIAQCFGTAGTSILILGLPALVVAMVAFKLLGFIQFASAGIFVLNMLLFAGTMLFAILINDAIRFLIGTMCFYTTQAFGLNQMNMVIQGFLSGSMIPISFFPGVFEKIVNALPFAGLAQNPVLILQGKVNLTEGLFMMGKNVVWCIVFELLCALAFHIASKKVTVQGG